MANEKEYKCTVSYLMSHQVSYDCLIIILQKKKPIWYKTLEKEK